MADGEPGGAESADVAGADVEIKVRDHGPYKVTGRVRLIDADGGEFVLEADTPIALCRCGQSRTKPFCDASHKQAGFEWGGWGARGGWWGGGAGGGGGGGAGGLREAKFAARRACPIQVRKVMRDF
jgi:CDGSH-type Zn-finger protein